MNNHFVWQWRINYTLRFNQVIYWLQRIPLLGHLFSPAWFKAQKTKTAFSILVIIFNFFIQFLRKVLYYGLLWLFAIILSQISAQKAQNEGQVLNIYMLLLISFNLILGSLSQLIPVERGNQLEVIFIKIFMAEPYTFYRSKYLRQALEYLIFNGIVGMYFFWKNGIHPAHIFSFLILVTGLRLLLNIIGFYCYRLKDKQPDLWLNVIVITAMVIAFLGTAFFIWQKDYFKLNLEPLFDWRAARAGVALGLLALWLWLISKERINRAAYRLISFETLKTAEAETDNISTIEVAITDEDLQLSEDDQKLNSVLVRTIGAREANYYSGVSYLNQIFFKRLGHLFLKQIRWRALILIVLFTAAIGASIYFRDQLIDENGDTPMYIMPFISVILCYGINLGEFFTKFCFYHLDRKMMKYSFYRDPALILESIKIRFWQNFLYNLPLLLIMLIGTGGLYLAIDRSDVGNLLLTWLTQIVVMLMFSMHFLIMYYTLQPFTESLQSKSPSYTIINGIIYILVFFSGNLLTKENFYFYPLFFIAVSVVYIPLGLYLVYKLAPRQFKLR